MEQVFEAGWVYDPYKGKPRHVIEDFYHKEGPDGVCGGKRYFHRVRG